MQKKIVLLPATILLSGLLSVPVATIHTHAVNSEYARQEALIAAKQKAEKARKDKIAAAKAEKLAKKLANKTNFMNVSAKNKDIKVKIVEANTGQQLSNDSKKLSPSKRAVIYRISIKNNSPSSLMFGKSDFRLKIGSQMINQDKAMFSNANSSKGVTNTPISVGSTITGVIGFTLDTNDLKDMSKISLVITNNYNNVFTKPLIIPLVDDSKSNSDTDTTDTAKSDSKADKITAKSSSDKKTDAKSKSTKSDNKSEQNSGSLTDSDNSSDNSNSNYSDTKSDNDNSKSGSDNKSDSSSDKDNSSDSNSDNSGLLK